MDAKLIDFASSSLASSYTGFYAKIIDDAFTPAECDELINLATSHPSGWKPAGLRTEKDHETVHRNFRNSDRVLVVDENVSKKIFERLKPFVEEELAQIEPKGRWAGITGKADRKQGPTWQLDSVNPRLSFLRYGPGHYFKPHCDGLNELAVEDGTLKSFVTLHLYLSDNTTPYPLPDVLENAENECGGTIYGNTTSTPLACRSNDDNNELAGGATRFWTPNKKHFLDVEPKIGRVLVFQQRMLIHSGEEVTSGLKYTMRSDFMFRELAVNT
ncbi:oxidoreductase domain-containing protein [Moniliophthora roreri MCA 2997]|uniref:Oxidoreductase domain-containing protein n=2 Tax=Moniliophthora roreri TaxID=221103 RepID=V2X6B7_MONRO|nr:oxidoreductase domain-containing protein [Moniliophthora roreri MCA 2997]KAI3621269.1 oxidoreductase domain-containing protein [Moniliophthora roreri]